MSGRATKSKRPALDRSSGNWSPILGVLLNGADFQRLSSAGRHVLLTLKIAFGPSGIEMHYRAGLAVQLSHQTGLAGDVTEAAIRELETSGWVRSDANVVWIVDHLRFHRGLSHSVPNHRASVATHVAGLPHLGIVSEFRRHYAWWLAGNEPPPPNTSHGMGDGIAHAFPDAVAIKKEEVGSRKEEGGSEEVVAAAGATDERTSNAADGEAPTEAAGAEFTLQSTAIDLLGGPGNEFNYLMAKRDLADTLGDDGWERFCERAKAYCLGIPTGLHIEILTTLNRLLRSGISLDAVIAGLDSLRLRGKRPYSSRAIESFVGTAANKAQAPDGQRTRQAESKDAKARTGRTKYGSLLQ